MRRATGIMAAACWAIATPSLAQEAPAAVGRITFGAAPKPGAALCTGALVASDRVLTAGHCVRGAIGNPSVIRFAAAWRDGAAVAERRGAKVVIMPAQQPAEARLSDDVAVVVLDRPIPGDLVTPLAVTDLVGNRFTLVAYRRDRPDLPDRTDSCRLVAVVAGALGLSCPVVSGNSGAPVLEWDGAAWRIIGVTVAAAQAGPIRAFAAIPPARLRHLIPAPD